MRRPSAGTPSRPPRWCSGRAGRTRGPGLPQAGPLRALQPCLAPLDAAGCGLGIRMFQTQVSALGPHVPLAVSDSCLLYFLLYALLLPHALLPFALWGHHVRDPQCRVSCVRLLLSVVTLRLIHLGSSMLSRASALHLVAPHSVPVASGAALSLRTPVSWAWPLDAVGHGWGRSHRSTWSPCARAWLALGGQSQLMCGFSGLSSENTARPVSSCSWACGCPLRQCCAPHGSSSPLSA